MRTLRKRFGPITFNNNYGIYEIHSLELQITRTAVQGVQNIRRNQRRNNNKNIL